MPFGLEEAKALERKTRQESFMAKLYAARCAFR
jgi:hypothetical protein